MSRIDIGQLDRRVTLQSPTYSTGATGEAVATYSTAATVWAKVEEMAPTERVVSDKTTMIQRITVTIRYHATLDATWRIGHGTDTYLIVGRQEVGRREWLTLTAELIE